LNISSITDLINEVEEKFPVERWKIDGIYIWPIIRIRLGFTLINLYRNNNTAKSEGRLITITKFIIKEAKGFLNYFYYKIKNKIKKRKRNKTKSPVDVIFLTNSYTYIKLDDIWYEKFCDPIISFLKQKNVSTLLFSYNHIYLDPRYTTSTFIQPLITFSTIIAIIKFKIRKRFKTNMLPYYKEFLQYLNLKNIPFKLFTISRIGNEVSKIKETSKLFQRLLIKTKPKVGFQINYYQYVGFAFNLACHKLGIISVDIQHGVQGDHHYAYGRWNKVPQDGYELLPFFFLCWSDIEVSAINKWSSKCFPRHRALLGGNLFLRLWLNKEKDLFERFDKIINAVKPKTSSVQILYTLQGFEDSSDLYNLIKIIKKAKSIYYWWLRAHPRFPEQKNFIRKLLLSHNIKNVNLDEASTLPLFALLSHMDIHITNYSTVVIEAKKFGVPSIIINKFGKDLYHEQIKSGWVLPAYTKNEIVKAIEIQINKRKSLGKAKKKEDLITTNQYLNELIKIIKCNSK